MKKRFKTILIFTLIIFFCINLQVWAQDAAEEYRSVKLGIIKEVKSSVNNKEYELIINYPSTYSQNPDKKYPVVYFCDGYYDFPLLTMIYNNLKYDQRITDCFLVGFSYKGEIPDYGPLRIHDYMPTKSNQYNIGGGADEFLQVVEKDFICYMGKNFRVDPEWRALGGSYAGGMFTLYTLIY